MIIAKAIRAVYPNMLADDGAKDVWFSMLQDLSYQQVSAALQVHIMTSKFPPTIAELREDHTQHSISELDAWALVRRAIRNGTYGAEEEFDRLPDVVRRAVGAASNLRQWAQSDSGMLETIEAHFLKAFRAERDREAQSAQISPQLKNILVEMQRKMLEVKNDGTQ